MTGVPGPIERSSKALQAKQRRDIAVLAAILGLPQVGASHFLSRLKGAGLLRRQPGRADRRARRIVLTDEGLALAARVRDVRIIALRTMLDALDTDDEDRLEAILDRMLLGSGFDRLGADRACRLCPIGDCPQDRHPLECVVRRDDEGLW